MRGIEQACRRSQCVVPVVPGQVVTAIKVTSHGIKMARPYLGAKLGKTRVVPLQCRAPCLKASAPRSRSRRCGRQWVLGFAVFWG
jgi:hypothetical protein